MEWSKCHWNKQKQSCSVFCRHTDCKLEKGLFEKDSPLRDHLMFNYMQLETQQSSSQPNRASKSQIDTVAGAVSFRVPGTKIQTEWYILTLQGYHNT